MSCDGKVWADVSWAMTGAPIRKLLVDARTMVRELKEMLEAPAKTPAAYLDLLCEGQVLADVSCISHSFARTDCVELLAFRTEAPKLLAFLKSTPNLRRIAWSPYKAPGFLATEGKDVKVVKYIMEADRDGSIVNERDEDVIGGFYDACTRCTALHYAAIGGQARISKTLLDHSAFRVADALADIPLPNDFNFGYDVEDYCERSCTALHAAIAWGHGEICSLLLKHRRFRAVARANAAGQTALHMAVLAGSPEVVEELLADGRVDLHARTREGHTALDLALLLRQQPYRGRAVDSERIIARLLEGAGSMIWDVLEEAAHDLDRRLVRDTIGRLRGMDKFRAGILMGKGGKGHLNTALLFSEDVTAKEAHRRKRDLRKRKEVRKQQHVYRKALSEQAHDRRRPGKSSTRPKSKSSSKQTEFTFALCL